MYIYDTYLNADVYIPIHTLHCMNETCTEAGEPRSFPRLLHSCSAKDAEGNTNKLYTAWFCEEGVSSMLHVCGGGVHTCTYAWYICASRAVAVFGQPRAVVGHSRERRTCC